MRATKQHFRPIEPEEWPPKVRWRLGWGAVCNVPMRIKKQGSGHCGAQLGMPVAVCCW